MIVRCGRCGRLVRISTSRFQKLRRFDCDQCLATKERHPGADQDQAREDVSDGTGGVIRSGTGPSDLRALTSRERSIVLRTVLGFPKEEIAETYGLGAEELRQLLLRVVYLIGRHR